MGEDELKALALLKEQIEGFKQELVEVKEQKGLTDLTLKIDGLEKTINTMSEKDVDKEILNINTTLLKYREMICDIREEQNKSKEGDNTGKKKSFVSLKDIEEFIGKVFNGASKTRSEAEITIKAPEVFGMATFFTGIAGTDPSVFAGREIDPELYQRNRKRNLILDNFTISSIGVPELLYMEKIEVGDANTVAGDAGGAEWIASGDAKPMRSFRVGTGKVEAKKLAIFGTVEDKLLKDVSGMELFIREDFVEEMRETYNDGLLNNNPAINPDGPIGLKTNAITFAPTPAFDSQISSPNIIDAIVAGAAYMGSLKEIPQKVFVAEDVFFAMHILKDADDKYKNNSLVYVNAVGALFIAGIEVVPSDAEDIPSTHLLFTSANVGFKIRNFGDVVFERGLNDDDFRKDRTSYRGYQEVLSYIPSHKLNGVMYDTIANILSAIAKP